KDMCQLVHDPKIVCMRLNSQVVKRKEYVPPVELCDEAWVEKKFGVPADKVVDLLGLMGDSIDNIPGAPGIGAKGAVQVITQFGSIEEALKRWEEVKHKTYRESLRDNADLIRQSRELARIRLDLDMDLDLDMIKARPPDRAAAYELFKELEFSALTREFADAATATPAAESASFNYRIVDSRAALDNLVESLWDAENVGIAIADATTASAEKRQATQEQLHGQGDEQCVIEYEIAEGIAFSTKEGSAAFVDFNRFGEGRDAAVETLKEVLSNGLLEKS